MSERSQYLLALYIVEHRHRPPVAPGRVAELVGRTPATAIEAFHRFDDEGLVAYEPYEGVELTGRGHEVAAELHETYVTLSWFFRGVLELDDYEGEAMQMAGVLSPDVAARLASTLPYERAEDGAGRTSTRDGDG